MASGGGGGGGGGGSQIVVPNLYGAFVRRALINVLGFDNNLPNDTLTPFIPAYVKYDDNVFWDPANPARLTFRKAGKYQVGGTIAWGTSVSDIRFVTVRKNGDDDFRIISDVRVPQDAQNNEGQIVTRVMGFQAGDYVEFIIYQSTGSPLLVYTENEPWGNFWVQKVDENTVDAGACIFRDSNQTIPSLVNTPITFSDAHYDSGGFWDPGQPTKLLIPRAGRYIVGCNLDWVPNDTSVRYARITRNGFADIARDVNSRPALQGACSTQWLQQAYDFHAGEYLELIVLQFITGGGDLDVEADPNCSPEMWIQEVGR